MDIKTLIIASALGLGIAGVEVASLPIASWMGPPLICRGLEIDGAPTLPLPDGSEAPSVRRTLVHDTLALLDARTPVVVRMETVRRALLLGQRDRETLGALFIALQTRALDSAARGKGDALAWFDAGYMAAAWRELDGQGAPIAGLKDGCAGYAWIVKAIELAGDDGAMEFGAALATHPAMHKGTHEVYRRHLARAAALSKGEGMLGKNLKEHCRNWNEPFEELQREGGARTDADSAR